MAMAERPERRPPRGELAALREHLPVAVFAALLILVAAAWQSGAIGRQPVVAMAFALALALGRSAFRALGALRRRLFWRIRRRLVLSYVLIALVPLLLVSVTLLLLSWLATGQLLAWLASRYLDGVVREVDQVAGAIGERVEELAEVSVDLADLKQLCGARTDLAQELAGLRSRFPGAAASLVVLRGEEGYVPPGLEWPAGTRARRPHWLRRGADRAASFVVDQGDTLEIRAAAGRLTGDFEVYTEVVVPLDLATLEAVKERVGVDLRVVSPPGGGPLGVLASTFDPDRLPRGTVAALPVLGAFSIRPLSWMTGAERAQDRLVVAQRSLGELYRDLRGFRAENRALVLTLLTAVAFTFLLIEGASLALGVKLARSITGSIHEISEGTRRIERGDLSHRLVVRSDDQLGDLARSFNRMTEAVDQLIRQSAESERLEEELRIGRRIQQSLLPPCGWHRGPFHLAALSLPAREVGGDYYDFFDLADDRTGVLVADVSGKGTEAAFYMAEVKGLMLALARSGAAPTQVLEQANSLLSKSLDRRTFVTMTYGVLDGRERRFTFGRAGHCPLLYIGGGNRHVEVHKPEGLSLGLDRHGRFAGLLCERDLALGAGDVVLLYTDGVPDTMGPDGDFYGEERLGQALLRLRDRDAEGIRDALMAELRRFAAPGPPHDDVSVIVLRVEEA
jgi:serine phosphatase RsbU (regulator of sigma subunit)